MDGADRSRLVLPSVTFTSTRVMFNGMLLINKSPGLTSHDVVQIVRRKLAMKRVGHTGTLDPMAQGLLILLVGAATKHQQVFQGHEKTYEAVLRLGVQMDTGDATGHPVAQASVPVLNQRCVTDTLISFVGECSQTPPAYSAVKVRGRPAYWWARRSQPVTLTPRPVRISMMELICLDATTITFRVHCSAGTYIRTLAESIAQRLGTVGHLSRLVRLRVGSWNLEDARPMEWLTAADPERLARELRPVPSTSVSSECE